MEPEASPIVARIEALARIGEITAGVAAAIALAGLGRAVFTRTLGRRRVAAAKLQRLAVNVHVGYFEQLLGQAAFKTAGDQETQHIFVDPLFYVTAQAKNLDGTVRLYSVTTRDKRFHPVSLGPTRARLGKTRFAELGFPTSAGATLGARIFGYSEVHYFGNPGMYQSFACGYSMSGTGVPLGDANSVAGPDGPLADGVVEGQKLEEACNNPAFRKFRRESSMNTYAVSEPLASLEADPFGFGPYGDHVRVLYWGRHASEQTRRERLESIRHPVSLRKIKDRLRRMAPTLYLKLWRWNEKRKAAWAASRRRR